MVSSYFKVLKKRNFFFLWIGQVISQFGDRLTQMALIGLVYKIAPSSSLGLAKIMSLSIIPVFLLSPVAGVYVDRWSKKRTMYWSDLLRGIFIFLIPLIFFSFKSLIVVYVLVFLSFCMGRFFIPAKMSIIPELVEEDEVFLANSLVSTTAMVAAVLGFGLGGIIVEKLGVKVAFFIDALTFIISAVFIFSMKITDQKRFNPRDIVNLGRDAINKVRASFSCEIKEGFKYLFSSPETLYASKIFFALFSFVGALYVVFIVFIQNALDTITMDLGFLAIAIGLGLFVGTLLYGRLGHKARIEKVIPVVLFFSGIYLVSFAYILDNFPSMPFALISCFVLGLVVSPIVVAVNTLIHSGSDNNLWGRIFSSLEIIIHLSFIIFMFLASYLAELFSPFWVIVITGIAASIFAAINMIKLIYNDTPTRT